MNEEHVFISYSRKDFYFAEFLALRLQQLGITTWFDMQRLIPGSSWKHVLQNGLDSCKGLVLIASHSAFISDYVRNEWQTVLKAGKPVYIVLFEAVSLPSELQNASIIDMRSSFDPKANVLAETIRTGSIYRDPLPRVNPLRFPVRLPPDLWLVISALWSSAIASIVLAFLFASRIWQGGPLKILTLLLQAVRTQEKIPDNVFVFVVTQLMALAINNLMLFGFCAYLFFFAFAFIYRRKFRYANFRATIVSLFFLPLYYEAWQLTTIPTFQGDIFSLKSWILTLSRIPNVSFVMLVLIPFTLNLAAHLVIGRSSGVLRWLPTGSAPEKLRTRWRPGKSNTNAPAARAFQSTRKTYRLYYDPADEPIAQDVRNILSDQQDFQEGTDDTANISIAIINGKSRRVWLENLLLTIPNLICIVTTSILLPLDEAAFRRQQWVDYRRQMRGSLESMKILLRTGMPASLNYQYPVVPESLEIPTYPEKIGAIGSQLKFLSGMAVGCGLADLLLGGLSFFLLRGLVGNPVVLSIIAIANLLAGIFLYRFAFNFLTQTITLGVFRVVRLGAFVSLFFSSLLSYGLPVLTRVGDRNIIQFFPALEMGLIVLLLAPLYIIRTRKSIERWLPDTDGNLRNSNSAKNQWRLFKGGEQILRLTIWKLFGWDDIFSLGSATIVWGLLVSFLLIYLLLVF